MQKGWETHRAGGSARARRRISLGDYRAGKNKKKHVTLAGQTRLNLFARRHPVGTLAFGLFIASPESRKKFSPPRPRSIEFRIKTGNDYDHMIAMECFSNLNLLIVQFFLHFLIDIFNVRKVFSSKFTVLILN